MQISDYVEHHRIIFWYIIWGLITIGLIIYAIFTNNYLFIIIILLITAIILIQNRRIPKKVDLHITNLGLKIDDSFTPYKEIKEFWLVYNPPEVKKIFFNPQSSIRPIFSVPLEKQNPLKVREYLLKYLKENLDNEDESLSDMLNRRFKF